MNPEKMRAALEQFQWLYMEGNIDELLGYGQIDWDSMGFTIPGIRWAVQNQYQLPNEEGVMISMFPIENMDAFDATLRPRVNWERSTRYRILTYAEVEPIHAALLEFSQQETARQARMASPEDTRDAAIIQLLTQLVTNTNQILELLQQH